MDIHRLVKMANDIAKFFEAEPDHALAVEGVAGHLRKFWEPRMRREIVAYVEQNGGDGLRPLAAEAVRSIRSTSAT